MPNVPTEQDVSAFQEKLTDWNKDHRLFHALEVIGAAAVLGFNNEAAEAAEFVLTSPAALATSKLVAEAVLGTHPTDDLSSKVSTQHEIQTLRRRVRDAPNSSLAWIDLALLHTNQGALDKAANEVMAAVDLAPANRHIIRSAVRFFIHIKDFDRAFYTLLRSPLTVSDPWLMAAEIAVSSLRSESSELAKPARRLIESNSVPPFHISELASSLATLEAMSGGARSARRLFTTSLLDPTENSIAQAKWATDSAKVFEMDPRFLQMRAPFEARAWAHFRTARWAKALHEAEEWLRDQPFSTGPALLSSYIASTSLEDFERGESLALEGLQANPRDALLLNNLAFAQASAGKLEEAIRTIGRIESTADLGVRIIRSATVGLIHFREGRSEVGRQFYLSAISEARRTGKERLAAKAAIFYALEAQRIGSERFDEARAMADALSKGTEDADISFLRGRLHERMRSTPGSGD